jgi:hypothetical protein
MPPARDISWDSLEAQKKHTDGALPRHSRVGSPVRDCSIWQDPWLRLELPYGLAQPLPAQPCPLSPLARQLFLCGETLGLYRPGNRDWISWDSQRTLEVLVTLDRTSSWKQLLTSLEGLGCSWVPRFGFHRPCLSFPLCPLSNIGSNCPSQSCRLHS